MSTLENIRRFSRQTWECFLKLDVRQKAAVFSLVVFLVCSVVASTFLNFVLLGAGVIGYWTAAIVLSQTDFYPTDFVVQYLPNLLDSNKPGGKKAAKHNVSTNNFSHVTASDTALSPDDQTGPNTVPHVIHVEENQQFSIDYNIKKLVKYILKDFVHSWYNSSISMNDSFSDQIEHHLYRISKEAISRLSKITPVQLLCIVLELFRLHVHRYNRARTSLRRIAGGKKVDSSSLVTSYETFAILHSAVQSKSSELEYLRKCVDILQRALLTTEVVHCKPAHVLLNEILSVNVLQALVDLISDADTVNEIICLILSDEDLVSSSRDQMPRTNTVLNKKDTSENVQHKIVTTTDNRLQSHNADVCDGSHISQSQTQLEYCHIAKTTHDHELQADNDILNPTYPASDRLSHYKQAAGLGTVYLQEEEDKAKLLAKDKCHRLLNIDQLHEKPTDVSKDNVDSVEQKVCHTTPVLSGLRMSYLHKLGIKSTEGPNTVTDVYAKQEPQVLNQAAQHNIPNQPKEMTTDISLKLQNQSPPNSTNKEENSSSRIPIAKSAFTFPIPLTSIGPSFPAKKFAKPKTEIIEKELQKENDAFNNANDMDSLSFVPVPMTALGPSFPIAFNSQSKYNTQVDSGSLEDQMSRSSSSSSFASVTYEEYQQNIPFEELDFQFAGEADIVPVIDKNTEDKKINKLYPGTVEPSGLEKFNVKSITSIQDFELLQQGKQNAERKALHTKVDSKEQNLNRKAITEEHPILRLSEVPSQSYSPPLSADHAYRRDKEETFQPVVCPDKSIITASPTKVMIPTLTRSKTTPALLDIQAVGNQEVARSEVRILEAKLGRFHVSAVSIPNTELTKDLSGKEYVLYCVEYDVKAQGIIQNIQYDPNTARPTSSDIVKKTVKRRNREFVNLHCRLEENTRLRQLIRGVKDPPKRLSVGLAFSGISKTVFEHRRIVLEHYLQQLISEPILGHSEELAEFLALAGDAHIEFVKKRTDIAPRIDQFLQWAVPSFVGTIKTAIPRAVTDLGMGPTMLAISPPVSPRSQGQRRSRDASALIGREGAMSPPPMDNLDMEWVHENFVIQNINSRTHIQVAAHVFLQEQQEICSKLPNLVNTTHSTKPSNLGPRFEGDGCDATELARDDKKTSQSLPMGEIELLDKIMALLTEATHVQGQPSWILDEKFQKGVCVMLGKPLDRWIQNQMQSLVSKPWCGYYLTLIQDAIWPNGKLIQGQVSRTEDEKLKMKEDALQCLVDILPGYVRYVIGKEKWQAGMEVMLDSLQDPQLNRHLVFILLDLLLEAIADEVTDPEFKDSILAY